MSGDRESQASPSLPYKEWHPTKSGIKEHKAVIRMDIYLHRWIEKNSRDMGMTQSQYVRFCLNLIRFEHKLQDDIRTVVARNSWITKREKEWDMTGREIVAWCADFIRVLDDGGLLEYLVRDVIWGEDMIPMASKKKIPESLKGKPLGSPIMKKLTPDKTKSINKEIIIPRPDLGPGIFQKVVPVEEMKK